MVMSPSLRAESCQLKVDLFDIVDSRLQALDGSTNGRFVFTACRQRNTTDRQPRARPTERIMGGTIPLSAMDGAP